jgi:phage-related protein
MMQLAAVVRSASAGVAGVVLLALLAACGGGSNESSQSKATPSASASASAGCTDVAALQKSLKGLDGVDVRQDGVEGLTQALADVATTLDAAVASASSKLKPAVQGVKTAFTDLQTAANGVTADNLRQKVPGIKSALTGLGTATSTLASTVTDTCPSP